MSEAKLSVKWIVLICTLVCIGVGLVWNKVHMDARIQQVSARLVLLSQLRRDALEAYFATAEAELRFWSINESILEKQRLMIRGWRSYSQLAGDPEAVLRDLYIYGNPYPWEPHRLDDALDGSPYSAMHAELHPLAKLFVLERGYYDFFLIGPQGDVYYSVAKEKDFATNLISGEWRESGLAEVYHRAVEYAQEDRVAISDMQPYAPSDDAPAVFMAKAMLDVKGKLLGVLAFQLPTERIISIMNFTAGMGDTGETYLVGEDLLMRSNSRFSEESTILQTLVDTEQVRQALAGEQGVRFSADYRGVEVLSAFTQSRIDGFSWAVMAEIDKQEILKMAADQRPAIGSIMLFLYALSLWSVWFAGREDAVAGIAALADLDFDAGDISADSTAG
ncbi:MAG: cache domain-containing protein [Gammaproteobacteria bacterium]|nr:cache domain-containing protein [Gammaproteobacteria bacterium]